VNIALLLVSCLWSSQALAAGVVAAGQAPPGVDDYLADLDGGDKAKRRLAARSLRGMLRGELRRASTKNSADISHIEALMLLDDLDRRLVPRCVEVLQEPALMVPCADILRLLETTTAIPALQQAIATRTSRRAHRHLRRALQILNEYKREDDQATQRAMEQTTQQATDPLILPSAPSAGP